MKYKLELFREKLLKVADNFTKFVIVRTIGISSTCFRIFLQISIIFNTLYLDNSDINHCNDDVLILRGCSKFFLDV